MSRYLDPIGRTLKKLGTHIVPMGSLRLHIIRNSLNALLLFIYVYGIRVGQDNSEARFRALSQQGLNY